MAVSRRARSSAVEKKDDSPESEGILFIRRTPIIASEELNAALVSDKMIKHPLTLRVNIL